MNTELKSTEDNNLSKLIFVGFALASTSLFTASSIQTKKHEKAFRYCHRERRKNAKFTTRTVRRLIREVFPDCRNRNIAIHLHPFNASRVEIELGTVEGTRMLSEATRTKFVGQIYYWVEGITRDRFLHEVGHLKDDYEGWLLHRDSFTSEFQGITYNKTASMLGISLKTRIIRGIEVPVEESAWNQVSGSIRNDKNKTAAVDTYRHGRNSYLLTMAGFVSLVGTVYVGTKSAVEIIAGKVVRSS